MINDDELILIFEIYTLLIEKVNIIDNRNVLIILYKCY